jgi:hypothetical protein
MWFFFLSRKFVCNKKDDWLYGIVGGMAEITGAFNVMADIIIQSHSSVGIGKNLYCILHGTGPFMGKADTSHCGI